MPVPSSSTHSTASPRSVQTVTTTALSAGENLSALEIEIPDDLLEAHGIGVDPHRLDHHLDAGAALALRGNRRDAGAHAVREIDAMPIEDDLSGHDTADIEQIVDEARHVHRLAVDDVTGVRGARLAQPGQAEHLHRALDGAQRIAQLVRQHRQELVLRLALALHLGEGADVGHDHRADTATSSTMTWLTDTCASSPDGCGRAGACAGCRRRPRAARAAPPGRQRR